MNTHTADGPKQEDASALAALHRLSQQQELLASAQSYERRGLHLFFLTVGAVSVALATFVSMQFLSLTLASLVMLIEYHAAGLNKRNDALLRMLTDHLEASGKI